MLRQPSLATMDQTSTIRTGGGTSFGSVIHKEGLSRVEHYRCMRLWEGRFGRVTMTVMMLPWKIWWQVLITVSVVYKYVMQLLLAYVLTNWYFLELTLILGDLLYFVDWIINMCHFYWVPVRLHIRVYRHHTFFLIYDGLSLIPSVMYWIVTKHKLQSSEMLALISKWVGIFRIYRLYFFFRELNQLKRNSRKILALVENLSGLVLVLHMMTCLWYHLEMPSPPPKPWYKDGYPIDTYGDKLRFDTYLNCFYYSVCRCCNTIFGDSFPLSVSEKILTSFMMLFGYFFLKYWFIGIYSWEMILSKWRWSQFVDSYHHLLTYLNMFGAPIGLVENAKCYKRHLWDMKNGVLESDYLKQLPHSLQTELIFDINVAYFHNSVIFRDFDESFMRQISLLVRHEMYLKGQDIWSQGVVKSGMICVKKGVVEVLSDEDDESPMIAFKEGTVMGELSLFYSIPSKVTVKAATYVELQVLPRTSFMKAISEIPQALYCIRDLIETRLQKAVKRQKAIEAYDKSDLRLIRTRYRPIKILKDRLEGVEDEDPTFVDTSHLYYRDESNVSQPKFTNEYLELYQLSPNVTTVDSPRICLNSNFPWILEPDTAFTNMLDVAHFLIVIYICIMYPYNTINKRNSDFVVVLNALIIIAIVLNIYIQFTTCIINKSERKETVSEIADVKLSTFGIYVDFLSVFPLTIFSESVDPKKETVFQDIASLTPILQVWHIWDYLNKREKRFESNMKMICLAKFSLLIFIFCYWSGCLLYMHGCPKQLCTPTSWMSQLIFSETKLFSLKTAKHEQPLTSAFAFGTAVFTGSGTADYIPGTTDLVLVILLIIAGSYVSCIYYANICTAFMLTMQRELKFKESMRELIYFLTVNRVSSKIKARVKKFFTVQWYYNKAVSTEELRKEMSANVRQEVLFIEMVEILLYCPLFRESSRDFLQSVASTSSTVVLPDNEIVQHAADISRDMYIVQKGHCNLLNHFGKVVENIGPGRHFGDIEMLFGLPKVYTVQTTTNCVLLHVEFSSLVKHWSTFPEVRHYIDTVLEDVEVCELTSFFEDAKPLTGRLDSKINRIAQEIKESFVMLRGHDQRREFTKAFEKLGFWRHLRYIFFPGCITPYGLFLKFWCTLRVLFAAYYVFAIPYHLAVNLSALIPGYNWPDLFLYIDVVVMSYVAYYNENSLLITHPLFSLSRYLKTTFLWDLIAVFPFEYILRMINVRISEDLCRINRLLLVTRISGAFAYWEGDITRVSCLVVMFRYVPYAIAFINFMTAIMFLRGCTPFINKGDGTPMVNCTKHYVSTNLHPGPVVALLEFLDAWFWIFEVSLGSGCTPTALNNNQEVWMLIVLQLAGMLYFAFMFGYIACMRTTTSHALLEHTEKTKDLENFLYQENVDPALTTRTLKYFEYVWKRTNGSNPQEICRSLNSALMEDTLVFMYEHALREVPLFGKVERSFIRVITQHLHEMYFLKGETVVQCRDLQRDIYIIYRGKVDVLNSYNEMVSCMGPGGMFGNFTGQSVSCSDVSVYASRSLDLLVLPSQTFFNLVKYYPKLQEPLQKAFALSKDYILPITMDLGDSISSEEERDDEDNSSVETGFDSRSGSSRLGAGQMSTRSSHSELSQAKSSISVGTYQGYANIISVLRPGSWLYQTFGYFTSLVVTLNYVVILYEVVTLNNCTTIFWLQAAFDIFFYLKVYLSIHQGYLNKAGELVLKASKCRARYNKHKLWKWTDVFVNFPLEFFAFYFRDSVTAFHYLRINKLFRLVYMVEFYRKTAAQLTNNITTLQAVTTMLLVILMVHTASCIWLITMIAVAPISIIRDKKIHMVDEYAPNYEWNYVTSAYVVVAVLTLTGGDEFDIADLLPTIILTITFSCGKMLAATIVATSIQVSHASKHALTKYERSTGELIDVLKNQGLSDYQAKKFWKYVQQLWVNERGRQLPVLLEQTPYVRRCDLMSAMFSHHLRNCYLFTDTEESCLRQLSAAMEYTIFFPGNYIITAGESEARMYWVASGLVAVVSVRNDMTETTHEILGYGDVFGILQGLSKGINHVFSYRAENNVSVLSLSLDTWVNIVQFFPETQRIINERTERLFTQIAP